MDMKSYFKESQICLFISRVYLNLILVYPDWKIFDWFYYSGRPRGRTKSNDMYEYAFNSSLIHLK